MTGMPMPPAPGMGAPPQPPMVVNPAYLAWQQQVQQPYQAEAERRQQEFDGAIKLLQSDAAKRFKIDIEADSTIAADEDAEKSARIEFLQAMTPFMESMIPQGRQNPPLMPLIGELIMFAVRAFKTSRSLEDAFETAIQKLEQMPPAPMPQKGGGMTKSPAEIQTDAQEAQGKLEVQQQQIAAKQQETQTQAGVQMARLNQESQQHMAELNLEQQTQDRRQHLEEVRTSHMLTRDLVTGGPQK